MTHKNRWIGIVIKHKFFVSFNDRENICPYCGGRVRFTFNALDNGQIISCGHCHSKLKFGEEHDHSRVYWWKPSPSIRGTWRSYGSARIMRKSGEEVWFTHYASV